MFYISFGFWTDTNASKVGFEAPAVIGIPDSNNIHVFLRFILYHISVVEV
jgi:hypothetical protein